MDFDKSVFDTVNHNTTVIINDVTYQGFGTGKANDGLLSSQLNHNFSFDPEILAVHLIVGYPSYSEYKEGATDLFKPSTLLGEFFRTSISSVRLSRNNIQRRLQVPTQISFQQRRPLQQLSQHQFRQSYRPARHFHHP